MRFRSVWRCSVTTGRRIVGEWSKLTPASAANSLHLRWRRGSPRCSTGSSRAAAAAGGPEAVRDRSLGGGREAPPRTSPATGASPSPRPCARSWTSPARSPSMPWTPRWPRRWCASWSGSRTCRPGRPEACASSWPPRRRRARGWSATSAAPARARSAAADQQRLRRRLRGRPALAGAQARRRARRLRYHGAPARVRDRPRARPASCSRPAGASRRVTDQQMTELRAETAGRFSLLLAPARRAAGAPRRPRRPAAPSTGAGSRSRRRNGSSARLDRPRTTRSGTPA